MTCNFLGLHASLRSAEFTTHTVERLAFKSHLGHVARALREIEQAEEGDPAPAAEAKAIRDCLFAAPVLGKPLGLASVCLPVLDGFRAGLSALDADMSRRLVDLADHASEILRVESRLKHAETALRIVLAVFDCDENLDSERNPLEFAALQSVYFALGLRWRSIG